MKIVDNIIFLHIPKTAGTTISAQLKKYFIEEEIIEINNETALIDKTNNYKNVTQKLVNKKLILDHGSLFFFDKIKNLNDYLIFTVLRNPLERHISAMLHVMRSSKQHSLLVSRNSWKFYLNKLMNNEDIIDYIIFYENLSSDLDYFSNNYLENITINAQAFLNTSSYENEIDFDKIKQKEKINSKIKIKNLEDYKNYLEPYFKESIESYNFFKEKYLKRSNKSKKKFILSLPKKVDNLSWSANDINLSDNCYYREKSQNMSWVWTGPDKVSNFYFNLVDGQYKFEVKIVNTISEEILSKIIFLVNDQVIDAKKTIDQNSHFFFSGNALIKSSLNKQSRLTIKVPFTLKFNEVDKRSLDYRYVGVAIQNISFFKN